VTNDQRTSFLTYYIRSLFERTRVEKAGTKFGFDWVIYNIALAADWIPQRLPFLRGGADEFSKTKTENEFGIDFAFLSQDRRVLYIFVLKDEVLNSQNWTKHSFDYDLRKACAPDISGAELSDLDEVRVILAYNKDEDQAGVELYNRRVASLGTKVGDRVTLSFERWNLTTITEKVSYNLLTPSLLPQAFFSQFGYLCSQFGDFVHGSEEWNNQLIPNWRRFLEALLKENADERSVRLLPVALIILREHGEKNKTALTGWIDLMEWAMLAAWRVLQETNKDEVRLAIQDIWHRMYMAELARYYETHKKHLATSGSLDVHRSGGLPDPVASAVVAHWHIGRLGILGLALSECVDHSTDEGRAKAAASCNAVAEFLIGMMNANPSTLRPILDIHHIELFLTWVTLWKVGRYHDIAAWLQSLQGRLFIRRYRDGDLPFIDGSNSVDAVFEYVATSKKPPEFCDGSSVFLSCILELCMALLDEHRDVLLNLIYQRLVLGRTDDGQPLANREPIDLLLWIPPDDWGDRVLLKSLAYEGNCISIHYENMFNPEEAASPLAERIRRFVEQSRKMHPFKQPPWLPASVIVLACLKHGSPLPPEFWRGAIFGPPDSSELQAVGNDSQDA
jgi:hypothetical protein